jgi:hypothetical protein
MKMKMKRKVKKKKKKMMELKAMKKNMRQTPTLKLILMWKTIIAPERKSK